MSKHRVPGTPKITGEGLQHIATDQLSRQTQQFEKDLRKAVQFHQHFWIAAVVHRISQQLAEKVAKHPETIEPKFDMETLVDIEFGCYLCEEPMTRYNVDKTCPGEPTA